jgi:hypothetical protein
MVKLTKEQFELLSKFDSDLRSAYYSHTVLGMKVDDLRTLMNLYTSLGYMQQSITCHYCVVNFLSTLGSLYFAEVQKQSEEKLKQEHTEKPNASAVAAEKLTKASGASPEKVVKSSAKAKSKK